MLLPTESRKTSIYLEGIDDQRIRAIKRQYGMKKDAQAIRFAIRNLPLVNAKGN